MNIFSLIISHKVNFAEYTIPNRMSVGTEIKVKIQDKSYVCRTADSMKASKIKTQKLSK